MTRPLRVLLIDDEIEFVTTLAERLSLRGLSVRIALNAEEALHQIDNEGFPGVIHDDMTSFENLFVKYQNLLTENSKLKEEIRTLKACLAGVELEIPVAESSEQGGEPETPLRQSEAYVLPVDISNKSDSAEKIKLFMSHFKGRDDVYARRWEN